MENQTQFDPRIMAFIVAALAIVFSCFLCTMAALQICEMITLELRRYLDAEQCVGLKVIFVFFGLSSGLILVSLSGIFKAAASVRPPVDTVKVAHNPFVDLIEQQTGSDFVPDVMR